MPDHIAYMKRCLELAKLGKGKVSPNPLVGSVMVHQGQIIGEGYHMAYGGPHAEVNAINDVADQSLLTKSTLYVNLEPCTHFGKTPPCSSLIIEKGIPEVVIALEDPNPKVSENNGILKMRNAGKNVTTGILEKEARFLNRRFITFHQKKRPYVILKWAQSEDGFIGDHDRPNLSISNSYSRKLTHSWRAEEDAIMVGSNTAAIDNPTLNVRDWNGKDPVRITIDLNNRLQQDLNLFKGDQQSWVFNYTRNEEQENVRFIAIQKDKKVIPQILDYLYAEDIQSVIIEGGAELLNSFIAENLWDEARVFNTTVILNNGVKAPVVPGKSVQHTSIMNDDLNIYLNQSNQANSL